MNSNIQSFSYFKIICVCFLGQFYSKARFENNSNMNQRADERLLSGLQQGFRRCLPWHPPGQAQEAPSGQADGEVD